MTASRTAAVIAALAAGSLGITMPSADATRPRPDFDVRFSTFNASLNRAAEGDLVRDLSTPDNAQARKVAETIQRAHPDVVLVNEFDYVKGNKAVDLFRKNYLEVGQQGADPVRYPYAYTAPVNTGVPSGLDLDNDGKIGGANDAYGFGDFPGQYGMVVFSKYPIDAGQVRTFQKFRWKDMPGARLPDDPKTSKPDDWYSAAELRKVRLSSKSHWDIPIRFGARKVHLLASHPTPPTFDGDEDRNGLRNHDEIRLWADYVRGPSKSGYIYDDKGRRGGLQPGAQFVVVGDQNSDPKDGDSVPGSADQLLNNPRVSKLVTPKSTGAVEAAEEQGGDNDSHQSPSRYDTADFSEPSPGNIRADYVLPSWGVPALKARVFWPKSDDPLSRLNDTSDHHLVWVDTLLPHRR